VLQVLVLVPVLILVLAVLRRGCYWP